MAETKFIFKSPVKVITSGTVPATLKKGEWAYGVINGKKRYFGNPTGSAVVEFTSPEYTALANGGILIGEDGKVSIAANSVTESMLLAALQTKINNVLFKDGTTAFNPTANYHPTTKKYVDDLFNTVRDIANGRSKSLAFDTKAQLNQWLAGTYAHPTGVTKNDLKTGDNLFIRAAGEPDWWWDGTALKELEGDTDLTGYYTKTETDSLVDEKISEIVIDWETVEI